ncbi:Uncharacterised protein [uncultured archaeon]|nr:Uncharacterised protein [uncultured archaeon]
MRGEKRVFRLNEQIIKFHISGHITAALMPRKGGNTESSEGMDAMPNAPIEHIIFITYKHFSSSCIP